MTGMDDYGKMLVMVVHIIGDIVVDNAGTGIQGIALPVQEKMTVIIKKITPCATNV